MANPFRPLKHLVFQKGGIGRSMSRADTVKRLNPIMRRQLELNHYHDYVIQHLGEPKLAAELARLQKTARADAGKIAETIYSCGGVAYMGVDLEPEQFRLSDDPDQMLFELMDHEEAFRDRVQEEFDLDPLEHQLRSKAILENLVANSQGRLSVLRDATRKRRRTTAE